MLNHCEKDMTSSSLFIGRFQPFHNGHLFVLKQCATSHVIIGVGSSQYHHSEKNPFTYEERKTMISKVLSKELDIKFDIYPVPDIHDPPHWVDHVITIVPSFTTVLTNNEFTAELFEKKGYSVTKPGLYHRKEHMGKEIRQRMIQDKPWEHLVPDSVATYLSTIDAATRLKTIEAQSK